MRFRYIAIALLLCVSIFLTAYADEPSRTTNEDINSKIELIGIAEIPGNAKDLSGLTETLGDGLTNNMLGGFSAIAYLGNGDEYLFLSDRGPLDGQVDWSCRFQKIRVTFDKTQNSRKAVETELLETVLLVDDADRRMTGLAAAYTPSSDRSARLDPEGIRVTDSGSVYISDEYGPRLIEFDLNGNLKRELEVPDHLLIENPGLAKADENPKNQTGRATNRGMEGLALSADQTTLFGLMQSPLLQDSVHDNPAKPAGLNCRLQEFSVDGQFRRESVYHLSSKSNKLNEVLSCGPSTFVVIERDGEAGDAAKFKKLMLASTVGASDVSKVAVLPAMAAPVGIQTVAKRVLIDLLDPKWKLAGPNMPEKIECLAFGPDLEDGRKTLVVVSDNDFVLDQPSQIYVFAVPPQTLKLDPVNP